MLSSARFFALLAVAAFLCAPVWADAPASDPAPLVQAYLQEQMLQEIARVSVTADEIVVRGVAKDADLLLAEVPMEKLLSDPARWVFTMPVVPGSDGTYVIRLPRRVEGRDRLLSKWQLVAKGADGVLTPKSHARYADDIACRAPNLPEAKPATKKGLGGWDAGRGPADELKVLGISAVTVNVMVNEVIALEPGPERTPITWQGHTYYAREDRLKGYDATFLAAAKNRVMVSAILLVPNPAKVGAAADPVVKTMGHRDATPEGIFAMPAVTSADGIALYGAALNLMAERWSQPDGAHGRVHHWIIHNEVDAGWTWTNCGVKEAASFMDLYYRSLRLTHLIARQYDPHAQAFISLTHYWTKTEDAHYYAGRTLLELLADFSRVEGNFAWAIAFHPYPQSLANPRTWEDALAQPSFDTPQITPRNLEVLDAWDRQPAMAGPDGKPRVIHLSENGFNSPDYSEKSLSDQAAGMAYAWKKIEKLDTIRMWQYHNWIDNRGEGGLRIGLRKFPDEPGHELEPKPIWKLYHDLATPREDAACSPYLSVTGLSNWREIQGKREIK